MRCMWVTALIAAISATNSASGKGLLSQSTVRARLDANSRAARIDQPAQQWRGAITILVVIIVHPVQHPQQQRQAQPIAPLAWSLRVVGVQLHRRINIARRS